MNFCSPTGSALQSRNNDLPFSPASLHPHSQPFCATVLVSKITSKLQSRVLLAALINVPFLRQKSPTSNACKTVRINRENLKFWNLAFGKLNFKIRNKTISLLRHFKTRLTLLRERSDKQPDRPLLRVSA